MIFEDLSIKASDPFKELIKETSIVDKFIDYDEFKNIRLIGSGTFGSTYHAVIETFNISVALKSIENIDVITVKEILNEINLNKDFIHDNIIKFYGITKKEGLQYLLVQEYADSGTITTYLQNNFHKLNWEHKLNLAQQLINGIKFMHEKEIIHGNLHSNNILVHKDNIKITDIGFFGRLPDVFNLSNKFPKTLRYIDPQCLQYEEYKVSKKSDIYSLGILLWEISSGYPPFETINGTDDPSELMITVLYGVREKFIEGTPISYAILYNDCWQKDPARRPSIQEISLSFERLKTESIHEGNGVIKNHLLFNNVISNSSYTVQADLDQLMHNYKALDMKDNYIDLNTDDNNSKDFFKQIVKELCDLYNEERMKGKYIMITYDLMDEFFKKKRQTPETIINWCLINQENPMVQCFLGHCYSNGKWIERDYEKAFKIEKEDVAGYNNLGYCYDTGNGIEEEREKAFMYYKKAAEKGLPVGQHNLASCYENGIGTEKNEKLAFELYKISIENGYSKAYNRLGDCYNLGIGTEIDEEKAFLCYRNAAEDP
ncbi:kinase-like domain-containing protein [Gigaspora rosea]|uniref:Kinase-like domain-containing protein n=1 Tax=Gigaspora rosea TaxID=44941 RepID=A0A397V848_9GLOM|nr:kinase-like domain-containing protein [Gigaspora rosea]